MIKLFLYIGILILLCYVLNYFYLKNRQSFKELKKTYIDLKKAREDLYNLFKDNEL